MEMSASWLEIDTFALIQNVRAVRKLIGDMPLWAVVKGNAYGHGLDLAAEAFWRGGVDGLVVADPDDAKQLGEKRYKLPILILFPVPDDLLSLASAQGWHLAVTSVEDFRRYDHFAMVRQKPLTVHLEIETGLHHTGVRAEEVENMLAATQRADSKLTFAGMFTDLYAPLNHQVSEKQLMQLQELRFALQRKNVTLPPAHVFGSQALGVYGEDYSFDAVRLGSALYGLSPYFADSAPALTWKSTVIATGQLRSGETVGYNASFTARYLIRYAVVPVGFSDGLDPRLTSKGHVLLGGKMCAIIGDIGMNHTVVDVSNLYKVERGDEAILIGNQKDASITIAHMAKWAGISEYELLTRINSSLPRVKTK